MPPTALTYQYTSRAWIESLLSVEGVSLRLDDDASATESATETAYLTSQGVNIATGRVNLYAASRYQPSGLVNSWTVWNWATVIAARWICSRRGNPNPQAFQDQYEEVLEELKALNKGELALDDVDPRDELWPAWSNMEFDPRYWRNKLRVIQGTSEGSKGYVQKRSRWSQMIIEI